MSPKTVVQTSIKHGLDIIAICDHNSCENVKAVKKAALPYDLSVIAGMEINSKEEVHLLGLFPKDDLLEEVQNIVYSNLPGKNDRDFFGDQIVMDEDDRIINQNNRLLIGATGLSVEEIVKIIHQFEGLAIASHIDRPSYSLISQLGFVPEDLGLDGVEVFSKEMPKVPENMPVVFSSDAHRPEEIGRRYTRFSLNGGNFSEIRMAFKGIKDHKIIAVE